MDLRRVHFFSATQDPREGFPELAEITLGHRLADAEVLGITSLWHVVGAEEDVPEREQAREILVPGLAIPRVVPAMAVVLMLTLPAELVTLSNKRTA